MIKLKNVGIDIIADLTGRLDSQTSVQFEDSLKKTIKENHNSSIVLNFENVEYISSSAIKALLILHRLLKAKNNSLILCNINHAIDKALEASEVKKIFIILNDLESALQFLPTL